MYPVLYRLSIYSLFYSYSYQPKAAVFIMPDDRKNIDAKKIASIISNLRKIDPEKADHVYNVYKNLLFKTKSKLAREKFLDFVRAVWPEFISGYHHKEIAKKFELVAQGKLKRLIVNMPPRHTKSEFASYLFPAWMIGRNPKLKIIQTTHTAELSYRFGRKVRNLIDTADYQKIFPDITLAQDSKASGRWETNKAGEYFGAGTGGAITGRGADLLIIDDPHSEQDANSSTAFDNAYEWYTSGPRQRLQPGGAIVVVMTRWSTKDLTGKLVRAQAEDIKSDKWDVINFPAVFESGKPCWPEYWNIDELDKVKASLSVGKWNAQWQQDPTAVESAIIKPEWWRVWDKNYMPSVEHIIQSYDTAYTKKETSDYSAITTWGVFYLPDSPNGNLILMDAEKGRWEFPELKRVAIEKYKKYNPDTVIIEAKASGLPLTHELRQLGIPIVNYTPSRGNDKHARVNSVSPLFEGGMIWAPMSHAAQEVVDECAAFPNGDHDDYLDSTVQAVMRYRQANFIRLKDDYEDEKKEKPRRIYY